MKKPIITIIILLVYIGTVVSQESKEKVDSSVYAEEDQYEDDPYFWSYTKEIGINFTPLVSKLVPFNLGQNDSGLIGLRWKKYYSSRAFRINFGANVSGDVIDNGNPFIYLSFGVEKRYPITKDKKLAYTSAWDLAFSVEGEEGEGFYGIAKGYGFEYHITKRIFLSTEAQMNLGVGGEEGIKVQFQLPTAIFVNVRLY
ncbi:MAG TPA: hypothetical protein VK169_15825 [Saprospiraceae bacterium]|nr:hypothetical protein [Saprospiraceae bacterium]